MMIYPILLLTALFLAVAFFVNKTNAKYLLAGYNTASEEQRKELDLDRYIPYLKKFHFYLALSFLVLGLALTYVFGEYAAGVFVGTYPLLAYIYFGISSRRYVSGVSRKRSWIAIVLLCMVLVFVAALFTFGLKKDALVMAQHVLIIEGVYGEKIPYEDIRSFELKQVLPALVSRQNGFALGTTRKGYFQTEEQEVVKVITNSNDGPFLLIEKSSGEKIFFSSGEGTTANFLDLKQQLRDRAAK